MICLSQDAEMKKLCYTKVQMSVMSDTSATKEGQSIEILWA